MAVILKEKLKKSSGITYEYFWDWSHYGWSIWEEGSAILSPHKIVRTESRYISGSSSKGFWKSRNVVSADIEIPDFGIINAYSIHMGWWDDEHEPFKRQFDNLLQWQSEQTVDYTATILAGDFNIVSQTEGHRYILDQGKLADSYAIVNPHGLFDSTIPGRVDGWENGGPRGKRIDYIFTRQQSRLQPIISQRIFSSGSYGAVSDHCGVYTVYKID